MPFEFHPELDGSLSLEGAIWQALGAASVCWENMRDTGEFQSDKVNEIGHALLEKIRSEYRYVGCGCT